MIALWGVSRKVYMKKYVTLLLAAALLSTMVACSNEGAAETTTTAAKTTQTKPKYNDDDLMINQAYGFQLSKYATVPELAEITVSREELDKAYLQEERYARESFAEYKDTEEGYQLSDGDKASIHYKGYSASDDIKLTEETLASMTNMIYDEEGKLQPTMDSEATINGLN